VKQVGAYLPGVYEEVVDVVDAYILTDKVLGVLTLACLVPTGGEAPPASACGGSVSLWVTGTLQEWVKGSVAP